MKIKTKTIAMMKFPPAFVIIILLLITSSVLAATYVWENVGSPGFSSGEAIYISLAIDDSGTPYVAYRDQVNGAKATVMKFNGTEWVNVGPTAGFSEGQAENISLAIDGSGTPYLAYRDDIISGSSFRATVKKFNGTNWVGVGLRGFSAGNAYFTSLAIDNNGTPYVAYRDDSNSKRATVKKFNGTSWVDVGSAGLSAGEVSYTSLAIDNNGTPYVAYRDHSNSLKATVMKFNGKNWENVGSAGFSAGGAYYTSLAIYSGTPYVAYQDGGNSGRATVMKFNGTNWENVGSPGFSGGGYVYSTSLAIDDSGTPYVAYQDSGNSYKVMVMKFNGTSWVNVGSSGFSSSFGFFLTSLAIDNTGTPYVAYQDADYLKKATVMKGELEIDLNDTSLSNNAIDVNETDVGTLTPTGGTSPFAYTFQQSGAVCDATNGADNSDFTLSDNTLQRKASTGVGTYQICIQVVDANTESDQHAYTITVANGPNALMLDSHTVVDDQTDVGDFSNEDGTAPFTYSLESSGDICDGTNGADNANFSVNGTTLQREAGTYAGEYAICAQVEDANGLTSQKAFTITVTASPSNLTLTNTTESEKRELIGTLATIDGAPVFTYTLESSGDVCTVINRTDNGLFDIEGNAFKRKSGTGPGVYDICIQTEDTNGSTFQKTFEITIVPDGGSTPEWSVSLTSTHLIDGDGPGTVAGSLTASISDVTYELVDLAKFPLASHFSINASGHLVLADTVDYDTARFYPLRIKATAPNESVRYLEAVIEVMQNGAEGGGMGVANSVQTLGTITIDVLANDIWSTGATSWDFHEIAENPAHGTAEIGSIVYAPDAGYRGTDRVVYRACDNLGFCVSATVTIAVGSGANGSEMDIPETGFAPGKVSVLPCQTEDFAYQAANGMMLEIPRIGVETEVVGVPITDDGWRVDWLGGKVGWLQGSAYPTWDGNAVITGHRVDAWGKEGVFWELDRLQWGDRIVIEMAGQRYFYEVREVIPNVLPDDAETMLAHRVNAWVTLVTCRGYDESGNSYDWRHLVRAVLVDVR